MGINVAAAAGAFGLIRAFGWGFGQPGQSEAQRWLQVLVAGFGAMAVLRSSFFLARVDGADVGIGPSGVIESLLAATDRAVDRSRGTARSQAVRHLLSTVNWNQAREELPALCLGLMQNATSAEQQTLARTVEELDAGDLEESTKVYLVGLGLMNFAGPNVLKGAVGLLSKDSKNNSIGV
ncbi:MAG TPA: hypothetical protein VHP56_03555 [Solirubrobacterales bacterium]|jgi:hypothetical protein|nr:hypothetical protein [Solirubrobacterales bacterium]